MKQQQTAYLCSQSQHKYDDIDIDFSEKHLEKSCSTCGFKKVFPKTREQIEIYKREGYRKKSRRRRLLRIARRLRAQRRR